MVRNRVNLRFLSTALDPQADVILSQSPEKFMPVFCFFLIGFFLKIGQNQVLGWFWAGLEAGIGISKKNIAIHGFKSFFDDFQKF